MRDEASFHLTSYVNSQNWWYWATENARDVRQETLHSEKILFGVV